MWLLFNVQEGLMSKGRNVHGANCRGGHLLGTNVLEGLMSKGIIVEGDHYPGGHLLGGQMSSGTNVQGD